jgi:lactoylglutathione lyase
MNFGYTIIYVDDVPSVLKFYEQAFGLATRFLHESNGYGELETGSTTLSFAAHEVAEQNLPGGYAKVSRDDKPFGIEVGFTTADVPAAYHQALAAGAISVSEPKTKPWGQVVAYVRSIEGTLVELCTPMN